MVPAWVQVCRWVRASGRESAYPWRGVLGSGRVCPSVAACTSGMAWKLDTAYGLAPRRVCRSERRPG